MRGSSIKSTYSLDTLTALEIETLARQWKVPKSEVIRRAVHAAVRRQGDLHPAPLTPAEALRVLQSEPRLSPEESRAWMNEVRTERRTR